MLNYEAMVAYVRIFVSGIHNTWDVDYVDNKLPYNCQKNIK